MGRLNIAGKVFSKLTVIRFIGIKSESSLWECRCECGNICNVLGKQLKCGNTKSCGCLKIDKLKERSITHGMEGSAEYRIWRHIKSRCYNENVWNYHNYGGRGIKMCDRWINSFENFFNDVGKRPSSKHSIDRYPDKSGDYEPNNCRWATIREQARNMRSNSIIEYKGHIATQVEISELFGVSQYVLSRRIRRGWSVAKAVETPIDKSKIPFGKRKNNE